jgi:hypothetical protein
MKTSTGDGGAADIGIGPDFAGRDVSPAVVADTAPVRDLRLSNADSGTAVSLPDIGNRDTLDSSDVVSGGDSATGAQPDSTVARDLAKSSDTAPAGQNTVLFLNQDQGPADAQCVAATSGWLDVVSTFLAEDQKCWADSDCTYVSFTDSCGMICPVPMNTQRIGEFGTEVYNHASANCASCPRPATYPACPSPRGVYCNAGRCEFRAA